MHITDYWLKKAHYWLLICITITVYTVILQQNTAKLKYLMAFTVTSQLNTVILLEHTAKSQYGITTVRSQYAAVISQLFTLKIIVTYREIIINNLQ